MQNKPKLRFKEFADDWEINSLEKYSKIIDGDRGINYPKEDDFMNDGHCLFLNAKNVTKNGFKFNDLMFITKEKDLLMNKGKLTRNDIVITSRGTIGNIAIYDKNVSFENLRINSGMLILRTEKIKPNYLYHFMHSFTFKKQLRIITSGNAQPQLTVSNVNKLKIQRPADAEQEKIANFLSKVDGLISEQESKVKALENQKKGLMQKLFSQTLRFTDSNNNPYQDWEEKTLGDVSSNFKAGNSITSDNIFNEGLYPVYGGNGLRGYTTKKTHDGTFVLIGRQGALCGNVNFVSGQMYISEHAVAVIASDNNAAKFLYYLFGYMNLNNYSESSAQPGLSVNKIIKLKRFFPCKEEQEKIANILTKIDELIEENKALLISWQQFKKGLLQQMFV